MLTLYETIYDFFYTLVFNQRVEIGYLDSIFYQVGYKFDGSAFVPQYINTEEWLCHTATIISITIILVMCCMFVYKIIKLIGGLIR